MPEFCRIFPMKPGEMYADPGGSPGVTPQGPRSLHFRGMRPIPRLPKLASSCTRPAAALRDKRRRKEGTTTGSTWGICTRRAGKLYKARSRLYRSQILQQNMRWKALAEIYTMHSFVPFSWDPSRGIRLGEKIYEKKTLRKAQFFV